MSEIYIPYFLMGGSPPTVGTTMDRHKSLKGYNCMILVVDVDEILSDVDEILSLSKVPVLY